MRLRSRLAAMVILATCIGSVQRAHAQTSVDRAVVIADAPILIDPTATTPLRVAAAGTNLIAYEEQGGWLRVQFQDPQFGLRTGYIATRFVRIERAPPRAIPARGCPSAACAPIRSSRPAAPGCRRECR